MSGISGGALQAGSTSLILLLKSHKSRKALPMRRQRKTFVIWLMKQEKEVLSLSLSVFVRLLPYNIWYILSLVSYRWGGAAWVNERVLLTASVTRTAPIPCRGDRRAGSGHEIWLNCLEINLRSQREWERERERVREREKENGTTYKKPCMGCMSWVNVDREGSTWSSSSRIVIENHQRHRSWVFGRCLPLSSPLFLSLSLYLPLSQFNEFLSVFLLTDLEIISFTRFLNPLLLSL